MKVFIPKNKFILPALAFAVLFFGNATEAETSYPPAETDSMYLYNALENKYSFSQLLNNEIPPTETELIVVPVEIISQEERTRILEEKIQAELELLTVKQEKVIEESTKAMERIESKSHLRSTVLGNNLGILEFELVQIKGIQASLNSLINQTVNVELKLELKDRIETLKAEQEKIEVILDQRADEFSFIGWLVATI